MSKQAMEMALEALEDLADATYDDQGHWGRMCCLSEAGEPHTEDCKAIPAIAALKEAIKQHDADPVAIPEGWQLVPKEPTSWMTENGNSIIRNYGEGYASECYLSMLRAAPKPTSSTKENEV